MNNKCSVNLIEWMTLMNRRCMDVDVDMNMDMDMIVYLAMDMDGYVCVPSTYCT